MNFKCSCYIWQNLYLPGTISCCLDDDDDDNDDDDNDDNDDDDDDDDDDDLVNISMFCEMVLVLTYVIWWAIVVNTHIATILSISIFIYINIVLYPMISWRN